ncbi:hypothetical protein [Eubacterium sp. MSJ-33]|uniref:hypothetical protein n=1 Tax=Eubacterium sp. MSJ-33 TaxID=2841528 RepID=UPI001C768E3F|nr:hypothetical protein [Eubacterium sp. MSJ-33]QWT52203.1 hypothetical protein KP625_08875 [Eubacterium sp. MSJ-33]
MDDLNKYNDSYNFIIDHFTENRIVSRYNWVNDLIIDFIKTQRYEDKVCISEDVLNHVVIDYFVDIYRLKEFQDIEKVHESKIYAYLSYWIVRHKPIQIVNGSAEVVFVNEEFVCELLRSYLFTDPTDVSILIEKRPDVDNFLETLLYYFKYRDYSPKNIEMIILAFTAGRGYQYSVDYTH